MTNKLRVSAYSVDPVKLPTEFAELDLDLSVVEKDYTDCAGCENIDAPDSVINRLSKAIREFPALVWDHWNPQDLNLRNKIAKLHGVGVEQVFLTAGAITGIDYCFKVFAMPTLNKKVGQMKPDWSGFEHYVNFYQSKKAYLENMKFPFTIGADMISEFAKREHLDMMIFANPVPVNGHLIPTDEIEKILRANPETMFIVDEADTVTPETQSPHLTNDYDNVIFLGSMSKFYGLSGLRIGYLISPKKHMKHFRKTINVIEVASPAILAGNIVMADDSYQNQTQQNVIESIKVLQSACEGTSYQIAASPNCFACFIYSETRDPKKDLGKHGIKILEGQFFGLPSDVKGGRFNLSDPAKSKLAADKIKIIHAE